MGGEGKDLNVGDALPTSGPRKGTVLGPEGGWGSPKQSIVGLGHRNLDFTAQTGSVWEGRARLHTGAVVHALTCTYSLQASCLRCFPLICLHTHRVSSTLEPGCWTGFLTSLGHQETLRGPSRELNKKEVFSHQPKQIERGSSSYKNLVRKACPLWDLRLTGELASDRGVGVQSMSSHCGRREGASSQEVLV